MSKIIKSSIKSPVAEFPGKVTLHEFLTMPQVLLYERAIGEVRVLLKAKASQTEIDAVVLATICSVVLAWEIVGDFWPEGVISLDTFPGSPRVPSGLFIAWLIEEIGKIYSPAIPKA